MWKQPPFSFKPSLPNMQVICWRFKTLESEDHNLTLFIKYCSVSEHALTCLMNAWLSKPLARILFQHVFQKAILYGSSFKVGAQTQGPSFRSVCLTSFDIAICKLVQAESRFSFLVSEQHCWLILSLWSYKILDLSMNSLHSWRPTHILHSEEKWSHLWAVISCTYKIIFWTSNQGHMFFC